MGREVLINESQLFYIINNGIIENLKKRLDEQEICLREERGVGAAPYINDIKDICSYAAVYVNEHKIRGQDLYFEVPLYYTKPLQMFSELHIKCHITDNISKGLGGISHASAFPTISKKYGKFTLPQTIEITAFANGNVLDRQTFIGTLYHELNHKIDELKHLPKKETHKSDVYLQGEVLQAIKNASFPEEEAKILLYKIVYRLFSTTEMNALVASVFGDLSAMGSIRQNYKNDIQKTEAYQEYSFMKKYFNLLNDIPIENYAVLHKLMDNTILYPKGKIKFSQDESFKKKFISVAGQRMVKLLHMISKTASYYYDVQEYEYEANNRVNETVDLE